jgi:hypothetical protein
MCSPPRSFDATAPAVTDTRAIVTRAGEHILLIDGSDSALFARELDRSGVPDVPFELMRLARGGAFLKFTASAREGTTLVVAQTDIGALRYVVLGSSLETLEGPIEFDAGGQVLDLALVPHGAGWAMAADVMTGPGLPERIVWTDLEAEPIVLDVLPIDVEHPGLDVASTGSDLAVVIRDGIRFVGRATTLAAPGPMGVEGLGRGALASGADQVVVAYDDGIGMTLQRFDADGPTSEPEPGPAAIVQDVRIDREGPNIAILDDPGARGWVLDNTLRAYVRSTIALGGGDGSISIVARPSFTVLYGARSSGGRYRMFVDCE